MTIFGWTIWGTAEQARIRSGQARIGDGLHAIGDALLGVADDLNAARERDRAAMLGEPMRLLPRPEVAAALDNGAARGRKGK